MFAIDETAATTTENQAAPPKAPPVERVRIGRVTASIWKRSSQDGNFHTATFERRYVNNEGEWLTTHSYGVNDLLALSKVADLALMKLRELDGGA